MRNKWILFSSLVIAIVGAWLWLAIRSNRRKREPVAGIVLLLAREKALNTGMLADLLIKNTGKSVRSVDMAENVRDKEDARPAGNFVLGATPHFLVRLEGTTFAIHNPSGPYVDNPKQASESIMELHLRKAFADHKAWVSMDIIEAKAATVENYRIVAQVLSDLINQDCLAIYHPPLNKLVVCNSEVSKLLHSDDPIGTVFGQVSNSDLAHVPVVPIDNDPRLLAAQAEALRRFPEFEKRSMPMMAILSALRQKFLATAI